MRTLLIIGAFLGAAAVYEGIARLVEQHRRAKDSSTEANRQNRIRLVNRDGQPPEYFTY